MQDAALEQAKKTIHRYRSPVLGRNYSLAIAGSTASPGAGSSGPSSRSHFATTAVAMLLPTTLVAERPISRNWSMPSSSRSPASGISNCAKRRGDHDERGARHAGDALRCQHQDQQHDDLLARPECRCRRPAR